MAASGVPASPRALRHRRRARGPRAQSHIATGRGRQARSGARRMQNRIRWGRTGRSAGSLRRTRVDPRGSTAFLHLAAKMAARRRRRRRRQRARKGRRPPSGSPRSRSPGRTIAATPAGRPTHRTTDTSRRSRRGLGSSAHTR
eukprot:7380692-Prymnesium_polylepis.1